MEYSRLGLSDIMVPRVALGTMMYGDQVSEKEAFSQMDYALERGVNFWDTAEMYTIPAKKETQGNSERILGEWFKKTKKRSKVILASKFCGAGRGISWIRGGTYKANREHIIEALEGSLQRLQTDTIDLYQIHWPDRSTNCFRKRGYIHDPTQDNTPIEETLMVLDELVKAGKIRTIGISNETPWGMGEYLRLAREKGLERIVSIQNPYNLLNRQFEVGLAEIAIREHCGLLAYSPLAFGKLSGKYLEGKDTPQCRYNLFPEYTSRYSKPNADTAVKAYVKLAGKFGLEPSFMALAFIYSRPFLTSAIVGATNLDQLKMNIDALYVKLAPEILAEIDKIWDDIPDPCP